mmetsp:Transcript_11702/g.17766  ORF Transcript_11702/g.17766 Transcript_11702/m.17766 type:complete len:278 (+) Transcript_11702:130-963(+)
MNSISRRMPLLLTVPRPSSRKASAMASATERAEVTTRRREKTALTTSTRRVRTKRMRRLVATDSTTTTFLLSLAPPSTTRELARPKTDSTTVARSSPTSRLVSILRSTPRSRLARTDSLSPPSDLLARTTPSLAVWTRLSSTSEMPMLNPSCAPRRTKFASVLVPFTLASRRDPTPVRLLLRSMISLCSALLLSRLTESSSLATLTPLVPTPPMELPPSASASPIPKTSPLSALDRVRTALVPRTLLCFSELSRTPRPPVRLPLGSTQATSRGLLPR